MLTPIYAVTNLQCTLDSGDAIRGAYIIGDSTRSEMEDSLAFQRLNQAWQYIILNEHADTTCRGAEHPLLNRPFEVTTAAYLQNMQKLYICIEY